jgi:ribosomal protein L7/L12
LDDKAGYRSIAMTDDEIRALLESGQKIEAIKRYREMTGAGLAEAKEAVEAIERRAAPLMPAEGRSSDPDFERRLRTLLDHGEFIQAIRYYREQRKTGLKQAKDAVEAFARAQGIEIQHSGGLGCLITVLIVVAVVALGIWAAMTIWNR